MFGAFLFLLLTLRALNNANYFTLVSEDPLGPEFLRAEMLVDKHKKTDELNMTSVENVELGANSELPSSSGAAEAEISKAALKKYHIKKVAGFQRVMEMVEWYFFFAFRLLMLSIPLALWLSSSLMFMLSSIVLVTILIINDGVGSVKNIDL